MKHRCCLLIESNPADQEDFLEAFHSVTRNTGCYAVSSGEEAISTIHEESFIPEYIFTEINTPGAKGLELLRKLREVREIANVPFVIYAANPSEEFLLKARSLGTVAVYAKTTLETLKGILRKYLPERR